VIDGNDMVTEGERGQKRYSVEYKRGETWEKQTVRLIAKRKS